MKLLGIDTGGTFTDFVYFDGENINIHKVLSTPQFPDRAILQGIAELGLDAQSLKHNLSIVHGSTVGTNAVLEGKGVKTALVVNKGMRDLLTLGRQTRRELYNLTPLVVAPPVERSLCYEVDARLSAEGEEITPLTTSDIGKIQKLLQKDQVESVAVNFLFSFLDDRHEKKVAQALPDSLFISCSSDVLQEYREYERGMATWLNAWIGPIMEKYLSRLGAELNGANLSVMQSSGGTMKAHLAGKQSVQLLLSGPAGGMAGARYLASCSNKRELLTFDMGGTSTDVSMINGDIQLTSEGTIANYPVAVPMVDMHTIGAGGGSIAYVDEGGMLHVGPQSAGASPGPACYGQGGDRATVTDANLVLGRIRADSFLGGSMKLDIKAAQDTLNKLAITLGLELEEVARGIISLVNENMARALRVMSVQRGVLPETLTLVSFGGAGGLHVCALADALKINTAIIPVHAGVLSALGMLVAPRSRELSRSVIGLLKDVDDEYIVSAYDSLLNTGVTALVEEGVEMANIAAQKSADLRYSGQSFYLNVKWPELSEISEIKQALISDFHKMHERVYSHALDQPVELVNIRVNVKGPEHKIKIEKQHCQTKPARPPLLQDNGLTVYERELLDVNETISGPALITEPVSTTYIDDGWNCHADQTGNLLLQRI